MVASTILIYKLAVPHLVENSVVPVSAPRAFSLLNSGMALSETSNVVQDT